jgi:phage shock protein PspC (stress-responsive transcriptional regulator)
MGEASAMTEHITEQPTVKRLERSRSDRMLAGVCGGLARYFDIHPAFYRVGFVILTLLGGSGILIYLAAYLVMPAEGAEDSIAAAALRNRRERPWPLVALSLLAVGGTVLLSRATVNADGDGFWVLLLLAGLVILWITRRSTDAAEDSRRVGRVARILAVTAAMLVVLALAIGAIFAAAFDVHLSNGVGDRSYRVAAASELRSKYELGVGNLKLDLRRVELPVGTTHLRARVDVGNLDVRVPKDVALQVEGDAQAGQVEVLGSSTDGRNVTRRVKEHGQRVLVLDAHVGAGSLEIKRAVR